MIQVGTRLGLYEINATLGAGGMGEVYRARDTRLEREVAVSKGGGVEPRWVVTATSCSISRVRS